MIALLNQIPSEAQIKKHIRYIRFGKYMRCVWCHTRQVRAYEGRYRCRRCRKSFSLLSGTWLSGTNLHLRTIWALMWRWTQKVPVKQTRKLCHVSEKCVRHWFQQFRLHLPVVEPILNDTVQMDEAYFRHTALLLAKQVGTKKVAFEIIKRTSVQRHEALGFLTQYIEPNTKLRTDGAAIYQNINQWWSVKHRRDIHSKFEFALTSEIEGMFGNLKTFIRRMYHHVTPEYLPDIVGEFCHRFSHPETFDSPLTYLEKSLPSVPQG